MPEIGAAIRSVARRDPFELRLAGTGGFPNPRQPQVVWAGVGGDTSALGALQQELAAALEPLGFPRESRAYSAHLTLGRTRRGASPAERASLAGGRLEHGRTQGGDFELRAWLPWPA